MRVDTPGQIRSQFDNIAYNKAGSVMMMVRELIGEPLWQAGLRNYLKVFKLWQIYQDINIIFSQKKFRSNTYNLYALMALYTDWHKTYNETKFGPHKTYKMTKILFWRKTYNNTYLIRNETYKNKDRKLLSLIADNSKFVKS